MAFTPGTKGVPDDLIGRNPESMLGRNVYDGTFTSPLVVAKARAIAHNLETMHRYCTAHSARIAPHAKTTMAWSLIERQLRGGAWGVTVATAVQIRALFSAGVTRVMLANQLVHTAAIDWAWQASAAGLELHVFVDSDIGLDRLAHRSPETFEHGSRPERISVLIEVGGEGGRTGLRRDDEVYALAERAAATDCVRLAGVAGYEGVFLDPNGADPRRRVRAYLTRLASAFERLAGAGLIDPSATPVLTAGGSACFDDVIAVCGPAAAAHGADLVLRSGCYVTHDHGLYERFSPLRSDPSWPTFVPALEAVGQVLSRPEPNLVLIDLGKRDVSFDEGLPVPLSHRPVSEPAGCAPAHWAVTALMDQHTFMAVDPEDAISVGDFVSFGISHPCTTFDKWHYIPEIDDHGEVVSVISTDF